MDSKRVADVSSFELLEATGDSEIDCDPISWQEFGRDPDEGTPSLMNDNEDAESRTYGLSESCPEEDEGFVHGKAEEKGGSAEAMKGDDGEDRVPGETRHRREDVHVDTIRIPPKSTASVDSGGRRGNPNPRGPDLQRPRKSTVSMDSRDESHVNEIERNRLFWEACLSS